jgi:hypothetical protein
MAKKKVETFESVSKRIGDLKECEQTPDVMKEIDDLTLKLESLKPVEPKTAPVKKSTGPAFTHEEWELEKHVEPIYENGRHKTIDNKPQYDINYLRKELLRKVMLTDQSQENALNEQSQNTLLEYIPIKKGE